MKRIVPAFLALGLVAVALFLRGRGRLPEKPEETVGRFYEAARRGDASACSALLAEPLKSEVEATRSQRGPNAGDNMAESVAGLKGFAVTRSAEQAVQGVAMDVELVFSDRNERQRLVLVEQQGGWLIASIGKADVRKPAIAYGTPISAETGGLEPAGSTPRSPSSPMANVVEPTQ